MGEERSPIEAEVRRRSLPPVTEEGVEITPAVAWDEGRRLAEPETWT